MTTLAFVAGMIPLVASSGTGAGTNRAIGSVIIGGQTAVAAADAARHAGRLLLFDDWANAHLISRVRDRFSRRRRGEDSVGIQPTPATD